MSTAFLIDRADDGVVGLDDTTRPRRRRFSVEYKLAILAEHDGLSDHGAKDALLRREGLYTSHLSEWRRARDLGTLGVLARARPASTPERREIERLTRRAKRLEAELATHRLALEIQGKASELLERLLAESDEGPRQRS